MLISGLPKDGDGAKSMMRTEFLRLALSMGLLFAVAGCAATGGEHDLQSLGLTYQLMELTQPRLNRVHVLRVDLARGTLQPAVFVPPDPDGQGPAETILADPFELVKGRSVLALVNANPWDSFPDAAGNRNRDWYEGQPVDIDGLAITSGTWRSPANGSTAAIRFDGRGHVYFDDIPANTPATQAVAGFQRILTDGVVLGEPEGNLHPRTALGTNSTGTVLWLVVVDGRQADYSLGMSRNELAGLMRDLGCRHAVNMDGGGSSVMALAGADGNLHLANSPSGRQQGVVRIRPLPTVLTIMKASPAK